MPISLTQTDTTLSKSYSTQCQTASGGDSADIAKKDATTAGTAGSTEVFIGAYKATVQDALYMGSDALGLTSWDSGTYTFRLNVTTPDAGAETRVVQVSACRMNAAGVSQATIGTWTGATVLSATTVYTFNITGAAQSAASTDWILFIVQLENTGHGAPTVGVTPDQLIDTPIALTVAATATLSSTASVTPNATNYKNAAASLLTSADVLAGGSYVVNGAVNAPVVADLTANAGLILTGQASLLGQATLTATVPTAAVLPVTTGLTTIARAFYLNDGTLMSSDHYAQADLTATGTLEPHQLGLIVRGSGDNGYLGYYDARDSKWVIAKSVSGVITELATSSEAFTDCSLRLSAVGSDLTLTADGVVKVSTTDTTYTLTGKGGIYAAKMQAVYSAGGFLSLDNFQLYDIGEPYSMAHMLVSASLTANATLTEAAAAALAATATLASSGTIERLGAASLDTVVSLNATGSLVKLGVSTLDSVVSMVNVGTLNLGASSSLGVVAGLNAIPSKDVSGTGTLAASASLQALSGVTYSGVATYTTTVSMDAKPVANWVDSATMVVNAGLTGHDGDLVGYDTFSEISQTLLSDHVGEYGSWGQSGGNLSLQIDSNGKLRLDL